MRSHIMVMCLLTVGCAAPTSAPDPQGSGSWGSEVSEGGQTPTAEAGSPTPTQEDAGVPETGNLTPPDSGSVAEGGSISQDAGEGGSKSCCFGCDYTYMQCQQAHCTDGGGSSAACTACDTAAASCGSTCGGC